MCNYREQYHPINILNLKTIFFTSRLKNKLNCSNNCVALSVWEGGEGRGGGVNSSAYNFNNSMNLQIEAKILHTGLNHLWSAKAVKDIYRENYRSSSYTGGGKFQFKFEENQRYKNQVLN